MNRFEIDINPETEIIIEGVGGALHVKSWDRPQIRMDFQDPSDSFEEKENSIGLIAKNDCLVRVPYDCQLQIVKVSGDAHITGIEGHLNVQNIGGTLTIKRIHSAKIEDVSGNLAARNIAGDLDIQHVGGNAVFKNIHGVLRVDQISGNVDIKNCGAKVKIKAGGNGNIRSLIPQDGHYEFECKGNVNCRIDSSSNFTAEMSSKAHKILVQTKDINQSFDIENHSIIIGKGSGKLIVKAGGHINFRTREESGFKFGFDVELDEDFNAMVDEISDQVGVQMESQLDALSEQLASLGDQLQISGDKAIKVAQKKIEAAQKRLEKKIRARSGGAARKPGIAIAMGIQHTAEVVSEQERIKVLEMVQEKKISVDEAELLLATLEGRSPKQSSSDESGNENNEE